VFAVGLKDRLNEDLKQAMKNKDKAKLSTLRMLKSSLQNESIKLGKDLSPDEEITVVSRQLKQSKDSLQEFEKAGRDDLADAESAAIKVLDVYMPEQLSDEELQQLIRETISEVGASSFSDMGKVMGAVMPKVKGKADGNKVNMLVKENLS
jgi:uncharacterized protein YqeY